MQINNGTNSILSAIDNLAGTNTQSFTVAEKILHVNMWLDKANDLLQSSDGRFQYDDPNHGTLPIANMDLVAGQTSYFFTDDDANNTPNKDTSGNSFLKIHKVLARNRAGNFYELNPIDIHDPASLGYTSESNSAGEAQYYDKMAHGFILDKATDYSFRIGTELKYGFKVYYQRSPSYFTTADTEKEPGIPSNFHKYLALGPAYDYTRRVRKPQATEYADELKMMEREMQKFTRNRSKDTRPRMTGRIRSYR